VIKREELVFGCMSKAEDDEMTFVLLGRDPAAPAAIRSWIAERLRTGKNVATDAKIIEAENCALRMEKDCFVPKKKPFGGSGIA